MNDVADPPALRRSPVPGAAPLTELPGAQWLARMLRLVPQDVERPFVWLAPHGGPAMVGWGQLARFEASGPSPVTGAWQRFHDWSTGLDTQPLAFGSFPFAPTAPGFLVVPGVTLLRSGQGHPTELICAPDATLPPVPDDLCEPAALPEPAAARLRELAAPGARESWSRAVGASTRLLGDPASALEKVVLSRAVDVGADRPLDQRRIASWLAHRHPDCWTYADEGLVGATPELLVEVSEGLFRCRILAGTRTPGWEDELLSDPKERHEHELSVSSVTGRLHQAGLHDARLEGPFLLRLPNVTHLATDITARLGPDASSAHITDVLFPTAAICGTPRDAAYEQIQRVEGLDRGRFSGPVGWIAPDGSGQWGLALRCAQLATGSRSARLFAGAGILPSSQPDKEWHETQAKMAPMQEALRHG